FATLSTFPEDASGGVVAIETAFFQDMQNEVRNPTVTLARRLMATFRERRVAAASAILLDSLGRADYPLELGYLAGLFREMLSSPDKFASGLPAKWGDFASAELARFFSQYPEALELYKKFLDQEGNEPSTCVKIARMAIRDLDVPFALQWVNRAASSDPLYRRAYPELAEYLYGKDMFDQSERVIRAGLAKFPKDPILATGLARFLVARGEAALEKDDPQFAEANFREAMQVEGADPDIVEKASRLMKSPRPARD
ncbi:MAG TPA: hypothetical protein VIU29_02875, partial [Candidatus Deferrimicrobiaceae bacterium]